MNKIAILMLTCLIGGDLLAYTSEQAYAVSSYLVNRYKSSNDWIDDLKTTGDEELDVEFPTADSLFACAFPSNSYGAALSAPERRRAFDQFLWEMSCTNEVELSKACKLTCAYALVFCADRCYANGIFAATNILARAAAPCRPIAYTVVRRLAHPTVGMNAYVYTLLTNQTAYGAFDRNALFNDYAQRLKDDAAVDNVVLTNGISMLRRATAAVRSRISLDELLARRLREYVLSSNRLEYAESVLSSASATGREVSYFSSVTNAIKSTDLPLRCIELP